MPPLPPLGETTLSEGLAAFLTKEGITDWAQLQGVPKEKVYAKGEKADLTLGDLSLLMQACAPPETQATASPQAAAASTASPQAGTKAKAREAAGTKATTAEAGPKAKAKAREATAAEMDAAAEAVVESSPFLSKIAAERAAEAKAEAEGRKPTSVRERAATHGAPETPQFLNKLWVWVAFVVLVASSIYAWYHAPEWRAQAAIGQSPEVRKKALEEILLLSEQHQNELRPKLIAGDEDVAAFDADARVKKVYKSLQEVLKMEEKTGHKQKWKLATAKKQFEAVMQSPHSPGETMRVKGIRAILDQLAWWLA